jgi:hypothetical protein
MKKSRIYLAGSAALMVGLFGSPLNAANMKVDGLACRTPQDLSALSPIATGACQFIPKGTFVVIERPPLNGSLCVRPLGGTNCLWVYEGQVINR